METKTQPTLLQRLEADTPLFFKKIDLIGLTMVTISGSLGLTIASINNPPLWMWAVVLVLSGIGVTLQTISKFAVKDITAISNPNASLQDYIDLGKDIQKQYAEVKSTIKTTIDSVQNPVPPNAIKAEDIPVVKTDPVLIQEPEIEPPVNINPITH
jgi:hypothetical protein